MPRPLLFACLVAMVPACGRPAPKPDAATITFALPEFMELLDRDPPRNRLTIDGEERILAPEQSGKPLVVTVVPQPGKEAVEVEFSYWPVRYSCTFRKKTVPAKLGDAIDVDLTRPDPARPDRFEAIYFPAPPELTDAQMELAAVGKDDTVFDIGCGDGRLVIAAVKKFGAKKAVGVDIRQDLVDLSNENAKKEGVVGRCEFRNEDALKMTDLSPYSVVFLYLGEDLSARLLPLFKKTLKPGSRVVSNTFPVGDWKPERVETVTCTNNFGDEETFRLYLWTVK